MPVRFGLLFVSLIKTVAVTVFAKPAAVTNLDLTLHTGCIRTRTIAHDGAREAVQHLRGFSQFLRGELPEGHYCPVVARSLVRVHQPAAGLCQRQPNQAAVFLWRHPA